MTTPLYVTGQAPLPGDRTDVFPDPSADRTRFWDAAAQNAVRDAVAELLQYAPTPYNQNAGALLLTAPEVDGTTPSETLATRFGRLVDHTSGWVNVKSYGAKGDGTTDDTAAIQSAAVAGAHVFFPAGAYIVRNVEMFVGSVFRGAGRGVTILKQKPGFGPSDYLTDATGHAFGGMAVLYNSYPSGGYNGNQPLDGITIRDLTIDGNYSAQNLAYNGWGIYLNGVTRALVENVTVQNCLNHGITLKNATESVVRGVRVIGNGQNTNGAKGDGVDVLAASTDNLIIDSEAIGNTAIGFEDEGRFGTYNPVNRNARNRWVHLTSSGNGDHNYLLLFTDGSSIVNSTSIGGATNGVNVVGTTNSVVDVKVTGPTNHGIWVRPETYGAVGQNVSPTVRAQVTDPGQRALMVEGVVGGSFDVRARGVKGTIAASLNTDAGAYAVGQAYAVGTRKTNAGNVYSLTAPFTGTGLSVTAPTGTTTSTDNGGTWTWLNAIGSSDLTVTFNYDATAPSAYATGQAYAVGTTVKNSGNVYRLDVAFTGTGLSVTAPTGTTTSTDNGGTWIYLYSANVANYGFYAYNPTNLSLRDIDVRACSDNNVWIDGTSAGATGLKILGGRSLNSGTKGLQISAGALTGYNSNISQFLLAGNAQSSDAAVSGFQISTLDSWGRRTMYSTAAPTQGAWIVGDRVINSAPVSGQPKAWLCTVAGSPGTWTSEGNL